MIYCQSDYELLFQEMDFHSLSPGPGLIGPVGPGFYSVLGSVQKGRPRKRKNGMNLDHCIQGMGKLTISVINIWPCVRDIGATLDNSLFYQH